MDAGRIRRLTQQFCADIELAIRSEIADEMKKMIEALARGETIGKKTPALPVLPQKTRRKRNGPPHCTHEGCTNKHCGPGYGYKCREHRIERKEQGGK